MARPKRNTPAHMKQTQQTKRERVMHLDAGSGKRSWGWRDKS